MRTWLVCLCALAACSNDPADGGGGDGGGDGGPGSDGATGSDAAPARDGAAAVNAGAADTGTAPTLLQELARVTAQCNVASAMKYATDQGSAATVDVCRLTGAFFWKADMDIDCDGQQTAQCNLTADPDYQNQTSFTQSNGQALIASQLPYIVVPLPSTRWSYQTAGIRPGALAIVLYNGQLSYGVFGDEGPTGIIGEASYAMAQSLGIDPNPSTGGIGSGVTYIVFTGQAAVVSPIESHATAVTLGGQLAQQLVQNN